jgi:hypothetical protein
VLCFIDAATKMDRFFISTQVTDGYVKNHPNDEELQGIAYLGSGGRDDPILTDSGTGVWEVYRSHGRFKQDEENFTATSLYQDTLIDEGTISRLGRQAFILRGHVEQSQLQVVPFYARFTAAISALSIPKGLRVRTPSLSSHLNVSKTDCNKTPIDQTQLIVSSNYFWPEPV